MFARLGRVFLIVVLINLYVSDSLALEKKSVTIHVVSDSLVKWSYSGKTNWKNSKLCYVHPSWTQEMQGDWIWVSEKTNPHIDYKASPKDGWYFKKEFKLPSKAKSISGTIVIAADNAYQLFINNNFVSGSVGPLSKDFGKNGEIELRPSFQYPDSIDITDKLRRGKNSIVVRVVNYGKWGSYDSNPAGLTFDAQVSYEK